MDHRERILTIVKRAALKDTAITPEQSLFGSGLLDSFSFPDLLASLEKEFGIQIPDSDLDPKRFDSVELIEEYVLARE